MSDSEVNASSLSLLGCSANRVILNLANCIQSLLSCFVSFWKARSQPLYLKGISFSAQITAYLLKGLNSSYRKKS